MSPNSRLPLNPYVGSVVERPVSHCGRSFYGGGLQWLICKGRSIYLGAYAALSGIR